MTLSRRQKPSIQWKVLESLVRASRGESWHERAGYFRQGARPRSQPQDPQARRRCPRPQQFYTRLRRLDPLAFDLGVRKLVDELRVNLAEHYSLSLLVGRFADGSGALPPLAERTKHWQLDGGGPVPRVAQTFGVRSGEMARRWLVLPVRGSTVRASAKVKPWGGEGRSHQINGWLERGIDFQSVNGEAEQVIRWTIEAWVGRRKDQW